MTIAEGTQFGPYRLIDGVVDREDIAGGSRGGSCTQSDSYEKDALHFCPNPNTIGSSSPEDGQ